MSRITLCCPCGQNFVVDSLLLCPCFHWKLILMHPSLLILRAGTNHGNLIIKSIPWIGTLNVCDQGLNDSWPHWLATRWRFWQYYFVKRGGQYGFSNRKIVNPFPMYPPPSPAPPSGLACLSKEDYVKERPLVCFVLLLVLVFPCLYIYVSFKKKNYSRTSIIRTRRDLSKKSG